jgi:superfamily II DNA or RNA helicase
MTMAPWPEPIAAASDQTALAIVRDLWSKAEHVDVAVADSTRLLELIGDHSGDPRTVRIVTARPPLGKRAPAWSWTIVRDAPTPEFLLFYAPNSTFPESALVFTGSSDGDGWLTFHRRPLVLDRLRERFDRLAEPRGASTLPVAAPSIREQSHRASAAPGNAKPDVLSPAELYRRVLAAHFAGVVEGDASERPAFAPALAAHQERAYERACHILDRHGGVIVADAVGLGKTFIGLRLLERTLGAGGRGLVIVPASLKEQWERELSYLFIGSTSSRTGHDPNSRASDNLDLWIREVGRGMISLLSMESLGRRGFDPAVYRGAELVLVDEAHNFRNPHTQRYRALSDLVRHSQVALLTATPINNTLLDLQHLIDLFAAPGAFRHLGISDYRETLRQPSANDDSVQAIVAACVLRRTRRFLKEHYGAIRVRCPLGEEVELRFPKRRRPTPVDYDLAGTYGELFAGLEAWLEDLRFPAIDPAADPEPGEVPGGPGELLKIIMLKRLESSIEALRCTVIQQLAWCNTALRAIDAGRVLTRPDYRASFRGPADDPGSQLAFFELMLPAPSIEPDRITEFRRSLQRDQHVLAHIHDALASVGPGGDRKLKRLTDLLDGPLAGQKVLIFTEFKDTAHYIHHQLGTRPHLAQIDSSGARLGIERAARRDVIERFAPRSNGVPEPPDRERVDLLIATDVLSEGLNLQDASVVVSYDLPWNPVRLMQRIGRIDRLGALSEYVELHHFVPAADLDRLLGLMARLHSKVSTIATTLGLDHPVLAMPGDGDRTHEQIRVLISGPDGYDRLEDEIEGPLDPEEQAYLDCVAELSGSQAAVSTSPVVCAVAGGDTGPRAASYWRVSSGRQSRGLWLVCDVENGCVLEDQVTALKMFRSGRGLATLTSAQPMVASARRACQRHARGVLAHLEAARIAGDALSPSLPQCRIAAWLSRSFLATAHRLKLEERALIDHLLDRLGNRFTVAGERSLAALAGDLPGYPDPDFLKGLDDLLKRLMAEDRGPPVLHEIATLLVV